MAHVSGPVSTLPGSIQGVPAGQMCDDCGEHPATRRMQGETDSFGAEWADFCDACYEVERERRRQNRAGNCDWCDQHSDALINTRDSDEGLHGSVYRVCPTCYNRVQSALEQEWLECEQEWLECEEHYGDDLY